METTNFSSKGIMPGIFLLTTAFFGRCFFMQYNRKTGLRIGVKQSMITKRNGIAGKGMLMKIKNGKTKRICCLCIVAAAMTVLPSCSRARGTVPEEADTYEINKTAINGAEEAGAETSDMLPELSDDTKVITVDEATKLMDRKGMPVDGQ